MTEEQQLTKRQEQFCKEFLIDLNATQAAIRAGYAKLNAHTEGSRQLANVKVQQKIQELMDARSKRVEITADDVLRELLLIAKSDIGDMLDDDGQLLTPNKMPEGIRRAISSIDITEEKDERGNVWGYTKKFKLWDKTKALDLLGRHLKLFERTLDEKEERIVKLAYMLPERAVD